jgi:hypothetical protein
MRAAARLPRSPARRELSHRAFVAISVAGAAITLDQFPEEEAVAWRRAAAAVIEAALLPGDPQDPGSWPVFAALLAHAQAALNPDSDGMYQLASYLGASGSDAAAPAVQQQVLLASEETRSAEHPDTLTARDYLASWTGGSGGSGRGPEPVRRAAAGPRAGLRRRATHTLAARAHWTRLSQNSE